MLAVIRRFFAVPVSLNTISTTIVAGLVTAFLQIMLCFSLGSLLFSGNLAPYLAHGIGIALFSLLIAVLVATVTSGDNLIFPSLQSSLILILVAIHTTIVIAPNKDIFPTMLVILSLSASILGVVFYIFGQYKMTKFIRYVPYPVIGGFLAGNGILLIKGAFGVMTHSSITFVTLNQLLQVDMMVLWVPGVLTAIALFVGLRWKGSTLLLPLILILSVTITFGLTRLFGLSISDASARGILLGNMGAIYWQPLTSINFSAVDWAAIQSQAGNIITLVMVALIHLPLNLTGLELTKHNDLDIDREVRANGIMNLLVGITGGMASFSSITISIMNHRFGVANRWIYIIVASLIFTTLFFGSKLLALVPVAVLGGLLIFLGMDFIDRWVVQGYRKFTRLEYAVVLLIMLTVVFVGFLEGVVLGIFVMVLVFVATYSRISIVYRAISAANLSSMVERSPHYADALTKLRNKVYVLELTGFLFFGTADSIVTHVKARLDDTSYDLKYLIIDFRRVTGVDSSALQSLNKVMLLAETHDFEVVISNLDDNASVAHIVHDLARSERLEFAPDLDHALEKCEGELLEFAGTTKAHIPTIIWMQLVEMGMSKEHAKKLPKFMERKQYEPNEILVQQGDKSDSIYFIEIGQVTIYLNYESATPIRLRSIGMGTIVGEVAFFLNQQRSATVVSDLHTFVWCLSTENLEQMKAEDAELAFAFEALMLRVVAKRLTNSNHLLEVLR